MIQLIKVKEQKKMTWKNGKGITSQIIIEPNKASLDKLDFEYRLSSAPINEKCEFSKFPGYQRILLPIKGKGFALNGHVYELHEAAQFLGDDNIICELLEKEVVDLGLIFNPALYTAYLKIINFKNNILLNNDGSSIILVYVLRGSLSVNDILGVEDDTFIIKETETLIFNSLKNTTLAFFKLESVI